MTSAEQVSAEGGTVSVGITEQMTCQQHPDSRMVARSWCMVCAIPPVIPMEKQSMRESQRRNKRLFSLCS